MHVLVTGGTGHIGPNIIPDLIAGELMLRGYFGFLTAVVTLELAVSDTITRQVLGWAPTQPA